MTHSLWSLRRFRRPPLQAPQPQCSKPQTLLLRSLSSIPPPDLTSQRPLLLLSGRISTTNHLRQLLCRATVSGLRLKNPHLPLLNSFLHSLSGGPAPSLALTLFELLHSRRLALDDYTFTSALKAASRLSNPKIGAEIHSLLIKLGLESDSFVLNSLIFMYSFCGLPGIARKVFDLAPDSARDAVSWNSMASGYFHNELYREALLLFAQMAENSIPMDSNSLAGALRSCSKIGALNLGRRIHSLAVVIGGAAMDSYLCSSLISMYSKCGSTDHAQKLFDEMPHRNAACWTAMISGYSQSNQFTKAVELFRKMQAERVRPDENAVASVLSSCAQLGASDQGRYIHAYCDVMGIGTGMSVRNALIDMYSKCGDIERALSVFRKLDRPDVFSWTAMISGLAMNGDSAGAIDLFSQMEASDSAVPNEVTFLGVLSACSHGGLIERGHYFFDRMRTVYKLLPRLEHYGCMVDLLGRAKLLLEAEKFIRDMPIEPDVVIWRSLLFASRINGDVGMAEFAARRIMELEPKRCGGPVMLSNVYAVASRWIDVNRTRIAMNARSIKKQPGCSIVELNGVLHEFLSADKSHPEKEIIYRFLGGIDKHSTNN